MWEGQGEGQCRVPDVRYGSLDSGNNSARLFDCTVFAKELDGGNGSEENKESGMNFSFLT
jgi:hypothetical protein